MKTKLFTYLFFSLCFSQVFSQKLPDFNVMESDTNAENQIKVNLFSSEETAVTALSLINIGSDLYTMQLVSYTSSDLSIGVNTRLEEELPYEANTYDYSGFYYLDFGCSYNFGDFNFDLSLENILNFKSNNFSIDPNLETSNGITNAFYLSHEADALVTVAIAYNF